MALKSTLAFANRDGHRFTIGFDGVQPKVVNFNGNLNENPENVYSIYYPTVARRVVDRTVELTVPEHKDDAVLILLLSPLDPGAVFEKIVLDYGGYTPSYLYGEESPKSVKR